jgi:transposase
VTKEYRPWNPTQAFLLPPSPLDWLPEGHLAHFILELVGELDLGAIEELIQEKDGRGTRPYSPRMMTALLLYAYCTGVFSSRKIERATYEDVAFRVLGGGAHPDHSRINAFRLEHREALASQFGAVLRLCQRAGLSTVGHVSLDGTKIQANASKHKAMSYGRMKEEEKRLAAEIEALLFRADQIDAAEDERCGVGKREEDLPEEFRRRESRLSKIREAKAALEKEAAEARAAQLRGLAVGERERAESALADRERKQAAARAAREQTQADELSPPSDDDDEPPSAPPTALPRGRVPTLASGEPKDKSQRNFTDPDSRIMVKNGVFLQAFNAQAVVAESQVIVAHGVSNQAPDAEHLIPMLERSKENCGQAPQVFTADSGYFSTGNVAYCESQGIDAYIAVGRKKDGAHKLGKLPMSPAAAAKWNMHEKLASPQGAVIYARRKVIPEPVFGQIKSTLGFRRFSMRGVAKAAAEWAIVCTCHNIGKLFRALRPLRLCALARYDAVGWEGTLCT